MARYLNGPKALLIPVALAFAAWLAMQSFAPDRSTRGLERDHESDRAFVGFISRIDIDRICVEHQLAIGGEHCLGRVSTSRLPDGLCVGDGVRLQSVFEGGAAVVDEIEIVPISGVPFGSRALQGTVEGFNETMICVALSERIWLGALAHDVPCLIIGRESPYRETLKRGDRVEVHQVRGTVTRIELAG